MLPQQGKVVPVTLPAPDKKCPVAQQAAGPCPASSSEAAAASPSQRSAEMQWTGSGDEGPALQKAGGIWAVP